jgi:mono/diheme cytochrome c family protein
MQRGLLYGHWQYAKDDEAMRNVITRGLADKGMSAFGATLTPTQVTALITYIRTHQTNTPEPAPPSAPKTTGQPGQFE